MYKPPSYSLAGSPACPHVQGKNISGSCTNSGLFGQAQTAFRAVSLRPKLVPGGQQELLRNLKSSHPRKFPIRQAQTAVASRNSSSGCPLPDAQWGNGQGETVTKGAYCSKIAERSVRCAHHARKVIGTQMRLDKTQPSLPRCFGSHSANGGS